MANDIQKAISANPIKNGTSLVSCTLTGEYSTLETYVKNTPLISDIENKYDNRFDDPSYYYGYSASWKYSKFVWILSNITEKIIILSWYLDGV